MITQPLPKFFTIFTVYLVVCEPEEMEEKLDLVRTLVAAQVARVRVLVAVIAHVHRVHDQVTEQHVTVCAVINLQHQFIVDFLASSNMKIWNIDVIYINSSFVYR